jgi:formylmethanofuran dehydrogenase subunit A
VGGVTQIIIKNGFVIDPLNNVGGEVMDIAIKNGKIVDIKEVDESKAIVIDAKGRLVMAGGIDIHSHIAGGLKTTTLPMLPIGYLIKELKQGSQSQMCSELAMSTPEWALHL